MKVSVLMVTYNHEKFIAQAVDSVLMQEVNFDYELIIGEDCSTDSTRDILLSLQAKYPDKIKLLLSDRNLGVDPNFLRTLENCRGEYIAWLDGDDFWTSPHKLQKQVDFLDSHPECAICFHNAMLTYEDGSQSNRPFNRPDQKTFSTLEDLVLRNFIATCSAMYRRTLFKEFPDWWYKIRNTDWLMWISIARHGKIGYIDEIMTVYRKHSGGIWTSLGEIGYFQNWIIAYEAVRKCVNYQCDDRMKPVIGDYWHRLSTILVEQGVQIGLEEVDITHVERIFDNWLPDLPLDERWKAQVLAQIYERLFFAHYTARNFRQVRYCLTKLIQYDPARLKNRGVWSIAVEVLGGQRMANSLRWAVQKVNPN